MKRFIWILFLSFLSAWGVGYYLYAQQRNIKKDSPFVPSQMKVVQCMLKLAQVGKRDLVYDLGCGDGRIVISAAKNFGAQGVGVDVDPKLIVQSIKNAHQAGVTDRVTFRLQNLFSTDISKATVVTLFLGNGVNLKLRTKLLRELSPGSRIVSNSFPMGLWQPDHTLEVPSKTLSFKLYYWIVPADVKGVWRWKTKLLSNNSLKQRM